MSIRLGVVMDPIDTIQPKKDSTFAMLLEAQARGWEILYFEQKDLFLRDGVPYGDAKLLQVVDQPESWFSFTGKKTLPLAELTIMLMRKDPPFNEQYIYTTYLLEHAESLGVVVVNRPRALRDANEKLFAASFPQCMVATLVTQSIEKLHAFWQEHGDIVCKPLNGMGGVSIYRLQPGDENANVIFAELTRQETVYMMAQKFIPEIVQGDKRILLINGEPFPHALVRIPQGADWRGNLAVGAKGVVQPLTERDQWIAAQLGPTLRNMGLYFVGLDVIGDYLTEVNVTSPTCIRELDHRLGSNIAKQLFDVVLEQTLS